MTLPDEILRKVPKAWIAPEDREGILAQLAHRILDRDDDFRIARPSDDELAAYDNHLVSLHDDLVEGLRTGVGPRAVRRELDDDLEQRGIRLDPTSEDYRRLAVDYLKAYDEETLCSVAQRSEGRTFPPTPPPPSKRRNGLSAGFAGPTLHDVLKSWSKEIRPKAQTIEEGGVQYFDISDREEGQSVKTAALRRKVPLHRDLIDRGFRE